MGSVPSAFQVSKRRKTEAIANRKKAAENGPTFFATTLPAIKVPPQKIAVSNNFTYTNIVEPLFIFSLNTYISKKGKHIPLCEISSHLIHYNEVSGNKVLSFFILF